MSHNKQSSRTSVIAYAVWAIVSIFYAYQYILRVLPSVMMNEIVEQFNIDIAVFGQFSGIYYLGYALMHVPLGILLDRFGPKKIMPICILITTVGLLPIIFAQHWVSAVIGRCLIGMGSSAAILSAFKIIRSNFSSANFTRMLSFTVTIGLIGAIYGGGPMTYMCEAFGYKTVTIMLASLGIVLCMVAFFITPNVQVNKTVSIWADIREVFGNKKVIAICLLAGLMVGPLEGFADVWGKEFLQRLYGFEGTIAASLTSSIFVGMCFGAPVLSFIAAKTKNDTLTIFGAGTVMTLIFVLLMQGGISTQVLSLMFAVVGICCAYQITAIFKATTCVRDDIVGLTSAVANMIIMTFGYAFHSTIGLIIKTFDATTVQAYVYGVGIIPLTLFIGSIGFLFVHWNESRAKFGIPAIAIR